MIKDVPEYREVRRTIETSDDIDFVIEQVARLSLSLELLGLKFAGFATESVNDIAKRFSIDPKLVRSQINETKDRIYQTD